MLLVFGAGLALAWWAAQRGASPIVVMGPPILAALANALYWRRVRQNYFVGCVTACVVLADAPWRWMAITDLGYTESSPPVPAIRTCDASLAGHAGAPLRPGDRFVAVSMYEGQGSEHWESFDPAPAGLATRDPAVLTRLLESVPEEAWARLEREAAQDRATVLGVRRLDP